MVDKFKATVGKSQSLETYKGLEGEVSFTSDTREAAIHDGRTSGGLPLVIMLSGQGEPSVVPNYVGQLYLNSEDSSIYVSTGTTTANDWELTSGKSQDLSGSLLVDTIGSYVTGLTPVEQEKVTDAIIAAETIRNNKIARNAVESVNIKDGTIVASKIAANEITGDKIAGNTITATNIAGSTITAGEIASGTILANNIAANALTSASGVFGVISVDDLGAGTISASNIFLGSSRFHMDGANEVITVNDENGTLRTRYGKLGTGATDYGIQIYDDQGTLLLDSGGSGSAFTSGAELGVNLTDEAGNLLFDADFVSSFNKLTSTNVGTYLSSAAITDAYIDTLAANKIAAGTIAASNIFIGDSNFELDGSAGQVIVTDTQTTPVERVRLGKLGTSDYGLQVRAADGSNVIQVSDTFTEINADYLSAFTIDASQITAGTLQLTTGMEVTNSSGTTLITSTGIVASQIFVGDLSGAGSLAQKNSVADGDITSIDGGKIFTNSIAADRLNVTTLSAIKADLGTIKSGDISALDINTNQISTNTSGYVEFTNVVEFSAQTLFNLGITSFGSMTIYDPIYAKDGIYFDNSTSTNKYLWADDGSTIITSSGDWVGKNISGSRISGEVAEADNSDKLGNQFASAFSQPGDSLDDFTGGTIETNGRYLKIDNKDALYGNSGSRLYINYIGDWTQVDIKSGCYVAGTLAAATKNFVIRHPDPATPDERRLKHSTVEAPNQGENLYRFTVTAITDGEQVDVPLPSYWPFLNEQPQVWVNAVDMFAHAYGSVSTDLLTLSVTCEKAGTYNVLLIGRRQMSTCNFDTYEVEYDEVIEEEPIWA